MKAFLLSFTLFISAYLWATSFTLSSFEKGTVVLDEQTQSQEDESTCVKDMTIYCDYNTNYSSSQCWDKSVASCTGKVSAIRDISEAAKAKYLADLKDFPL